MLTSSLRRALVPLPLLTAGLSLLGAGVADAHVSVDAPGAVPGGYTVLTFRVPTESDTASTTKVTVQLPGFASARTEPMAGWQSVVDKDGDAKATAVTWTADPGAGVGAGQFQRFVLSVGPLPDQPAVSFPATQTYSDGTVVEWNQPPNPDGSEPEHPAPELTPAASTTGGSDHHSVAAAPATGTAVDTSQASVADDDGMARWLGGAGLVLGTLGTALGLGSVLRRRA
ncbi:YcnI family protein [Skermania piniformis]|uniref:YcnI family protein n=1 Tax=Skermania pinensis TaxID=39122 RepID=A0ABX8S7Z6_9ACTN|nr:YcnI family protein [Skermania piniformis]QXQ13974.1 YcnI family protein [Skermania piniformis]